MMNIIAQQNKRTLIFLKQEGEFFVATIATLVQNGLGITEKNVIGVRKITQVQKDELLAQQDILQSQNIFIIDSTATSSPDAVALLDFISAKGSAPVGESIPSPYFLNLFSSELLLSTQKTRGPNK